ncbi:hypothetical protein BGZ76_003180, partial [Entomortierella beljakovae]
MGTENFNVNSPETWDSPEHGHNSEKETHSHGWGFEFDIEAMTKDSGNQHNTFSDNTQNKSNSRTTGDDRWFGSDDSRLEGQQRGSGSRFSLPSSRTDRNQSWVSSSGGSNFSRWGNGIKHGEDNWVNRSSSSQGGVSVGKGKGRAEEAEDVWGVGGTGQWSALRTDRPHDQNNISDEEPIDELTKYWATPNDYEVIRSTKRQHKPFSDTPTRQHDVDNWGSVPKPVMSYNGEGYTSDVLIEQSKKEFWSHRNGKWIILNQSTDTKITYNQSQHDQEFDIQPNSVDFSDNYDDFELESYDYEGEGFVDASEWWKPLKLRRNDEISKTLPNSSHYEGEANEYPVNPKDDQDQEPMEIKDNHKSEPLIDPDISSLISDVDSTTLTPEPTIHSDLALLLPSNPTTTQLHMSTEETGLIHGKKEMESASKPNIDFLTESRVEPSTSSSSPLVTLHPSLSEFASPHDWLNEISKRTMANFQENRSSHEKEWAALMEKQAQDSQKLEDFINQTTQPKTPPKQRISSSVSLTIKIETNLYGPQELHVTG